MGEKTPPSKSSPTGEGRAEKIKRIFDEARKLPSQDRSAFLKEACSEGETRAEIETLLRHDDIVGSFVPTKTFAQEAVSSETPIADPAVPDLPDHDVVKRIGGGGFGDVYLAKNRHEGRHYAVKVIRKWTDCELKGLRRFKACVAEHRSLTPILHVGRVGDIIYYTMPPADHALGDWPVEEPIDYVPMTLSRRAVRMGLLPSEEVAEICEAIAAGLSHMHANGAVHGDVKPDNVFLIDRRWRLGDYSLVSDADKQDPRGSTPGFVPPDGAGRPESDAYALGITGLLLLSGQTDGGPGSMLARLRQGDHSEHHRRLVDVCAQLVEPVPTRRLTVHKAAQSLARLQVTKRSPDTTTPLSRSHRRLMGIGCVLGVIVPAALLAFQYRPPFPMLTLIAGAAVALAAGLLAGASATRRRVTARLLLTSAAGAMVLWTAYLFAWNLTTVRSPVTDSRDRYQLGFHMAPWTFTDEALGKMKGLSIEVNEPFDVMLAFAAYDDGKIPTVWTPWSVVAAGTLLIATFGLGCALWAVFCTAVAGRLLDSATATSVLTIERPAPPALQSAGVK